jgi:hypothetical protein
VPGDSEIPTKLILSPTNMSSNPTQTYQLTPPILEQAITTTPRPTLTLNSIITNTVSSGIEIIPTGSVSDSLSLYQEDFCQLGPGLYIVVRTETDHIVYNLNGNELCVLLYFGSSATISHGNEFLSVESLISSGNDSYLFGHDLAILDINNGYIIPIDMGNQYGFGGTWSPDNQKLVISSMNLYTSIEPHLGLVDLGTRMYTDIALPFNISKSPAWSYDGKWIAFDSYEFSEYRLDQIFLLDTSCLNDMETCPQSFELLFGDETTTFYYPSWSPDNNHLAFTCGGPENWCDICIGDINSSEIVNITNSDACEMYPVWSPDGYWIAYQDFQDIYVVDPSGANIRLIATGASFGFWLSIP